MTFNDILKESWVSIRGNALRSFLTILGVIIGVAAVVIMVAAGETAQRNIDKQFESIGTNLLMVRATPPRTSGIRAGNRQTLTISDLEAISNLYGVAAASPMDGTGAQVIYGNSNWATNVQGVSANYQDVMSWQVASGVFFDDYSVRTNATVAVVGQKVVDELFGGGDPLGQIIRIRNIPFTIVGVMKTKGEGMGGNNPDDTVIIPSTTLKKRVAGSRFPDSMMMMIIRLDPTADNAAMVESITDTLRTRHKLRADEEDDFRIMNMKEIADTMNTITGFMKVLLLAIASISLLVGSIGIMNMMLVSVAERTREIGIRKAIGAKEKHILIQFLSESIMISAMGSFLGMIIGVGAAQIGGYFLGFEVPISMWAIVIAAVVSVVVGIASGVFPALKATKLNPIDSLRYE